MGEVAVKLDVEQRIAGRADQDIEIGRQCRGKAGDSRGTGLIIVCDRLRQRTAEQTLG